jgi:hypothetical protein
VILLRPVNKKFPISQHFGENPKIYPLTNGHNGIDFALPEGNPVLAAADGVVSRAELDTTSAIDSSKGYGYHVRIQHLDGSTSIYGHFQEDSFIVQTGATVRMGDILGRSGNTGYSTGPHLHFEVRLGLAAGTAINPEPFLVDEIPPAELLFKVTVTAEGDGVRLRAGPGKNFNIIRNLHTEDSIDVIGLTGDNMWLQVKDGYLMYQPAWYKITRPPK